MEGVYYIRIKFKSYLEHYTSYCIKGYFPTLEEAKKFLPISTENECLIDKVGQIYFLEFGLNKAEILVYEKSQKMDLINQKIKRVLQLPNKENN